MTDKEIIQALECCKNDDCDNCPNTFGNCYANLAGYALDLINRQEKEIEWLHNYTTKEINMIRAYERVQTIKEFAGRLKELPVPYHSDIDRIAEEMVGAGNG